MVDLAGHTPDNILAALSYKPAPVQITMLDYFDVCCRACRARAWC